MNDVCAVQPAAQPDFNDGCIHFFIGKITESHGGGQLEERRMQRLEKVTLFFYETYYILFRYRLSVYTDTFAEVYQVRGSVSPTRYPASCNMAASVCEQEPLPLVPATWMVRNERWGCPKCSSSIRVFSSLLCMPSHPLAGTWARCYISKLKCSDSPSFIKINGKAILSPY